MSAHGRYRTQFFDKVVERAKTKSATECKKYLGDHSAGGDSHDNLPPLSPARNNAQGFPPNVALSQLIHCIAVRGQHTDLPTDSPGVPLVILEFDEAHTLTEPNYFGPWSALCKALRGLSGLSFFSLFLSTSGKIAHFAPPFTNLGFDQLALPLSQASPIDGLTMSCHVLDGLCERNLSDLDNFTSSRQKNFLAALNTPEMRQSFILDAELACLTRRLPIEFLSATYANHSNELEQSLHPSPFYLKQHIGLHARFDASSALMPVLSCFAVNKGGRGELVVMLALTLARDLAVDPPQSARPGMPLQRWTTVIELFKHLFHTPIFSPPLVKKCPRKGPKLPQSHSRKNSQILRCTSIIASKFTSTPQDSPDFFVAALRSYAEITNPPLMASSQFGKNDVKYTDKPQIELFEAMNPWTHGIFTEPIPGHELTPVIRIVFALAAENPSLKVVKIRNATNVKKLGFRVYDIWCAGLSPQMLCPVDASAKENWDALLIASTGWQDEFNSVPSSRAQAETTKSMNPGAAVDPAHWSFLPPDCYERAMLIDVER
ncbi:hypothetical protein BJ138DRAFT_1117736 [Hygrophoropsis aurantiaca]|uniref:Uncharacterized protein n=1 Tax=Hygrophoropsis aurantiaca TaxID=72124 RepID=A0ACB7ZZD8_9AGAM|nr:hypothetical protein BJ138DRAFT_1117736 [Hygrophoropsis aurantiaca]